jgi:hypothetical protein
MRIRVRSYPAPYTNRNGNWTWSISELRLIHAVMVVGFAPMAAVFPSSSAVQFALGKALLVSSAVDWTEPNLKTPEFYDRLDPSEKGNVSYWLGMGCARIAAHRILQVPRLQHAGALKATGALRIANGAGNRLADLVGADQNGVWHVFEAKGWTKDPGQPKLDKWKEQARTITHVNGSRVATSSRSLVLTGGTYSMSIVDPDLEKLRPKELDINLERAIAAEDAVIRHFLEEGRSEEFFGGNVRARLAGFDARTGSMVYVGVGQADVAAEQTTPTDKALGFVGPEGIAVVYKGGRLEQLMVSLREDESADPFQSRRSAREKARHQSR